MDAKRLETLLQNGAERILDLLALGQQLVERESADGIAQRRLGVLGRGKAIILHIHHRSRRVVYLEEQRAIDLHRHVILGDRLLPGDIERQQPPIDKKYVLDARDDVEQTRATQAGKAAEPQ